MSDVRALTPANQIPNAVCLGCRTALASGGRCDCGAGEVVDLREPGSRARLREMAWGSEERQRQLRDSGVLGVKWAGSGLGAAIAAVAAFGLSAGYVGAAVMTTFTLIFAGIVAGVTYLYKKAERREALRPYGLASAAPPALVEAGHPTRAGVAEGETFRSPLRQEACLAYEISLRTNNAHQDGADVVWREAASAGFTIRLDDGDTVWVAPGPVRFVGSIERARVSHAAARLRLLPALRDDDNDEDDDDDDAQLPCVPSAAAFESIVRAGDRVAVIGALAWREDSGAVKESPRAAAPTVLVPVGPAVLRVDRA